MQPHRLQTGRSHPAATGGAAAAATACPPPLPCWPFATAELGGFWRTPSSRRPRCGADGFYCLLLGPVLKQCVAGWRPASVVPTSCLVTVATAAGSGLRGPVRLQAAGDPAEAQAHPAWRPGAAVAAGSAGSMPPGCCLPATDTLCTALQAVQDQAGASPASCTATATLRGAPCANGCWWSPSLLAGAGPWLPPGSLAAGKRWPCPGILVAR